MIGNKIALDPIKVANYVIFDNVKLDVIDDITIALLFLKKMIGYSTT